LPTIHTENTDQLRLGLCFFIRRWTLRTNVCGVRSGEAGCHWDVMLLHCMCRNHTHACAYLYIYINSTVHAQVFSHVQQSISYACTSHRAQAKSRTRCCACLNLQLEHKHSCASSCALLLEFCQRSR